MSSNSDLLSFKHLHDDILPKILCCLLIVLVHYSYDMALGKQQYVVEIEKSIKLFVGKENMDYLYDR